MCRMSHIHIPHQASDTVLMYLFEYLHLCAHPLWQKLSQAASLMSQELYELWTDPSSLSYTDLRQGNENNEQSGPRQFGPSPTGPHCTMGHRTDRQGTRGPHYQVCSPNEERARGSKGQHWWWMREQQGVCSGQVWEAGVRLVVKTVQRLEVLAAW